MSAMLVLQACWVLHCFCDVKFKNPRNLEQALLLTRTLLTKDTELPVQVEAAIALQVLLTEQERGSLSFNRLYSLRFPTSIDGFGSRVFQLFTGFKIFHAVNY